MYYKSIYTFISIHAPRVGCDLTCYYGCGHLPHFNPRTPGGVRPQPVVSASVAAYISIHAPRVGCDYAANAKLLAVKNFNPRTPGGVRLARIQSSFVGYCNFNPRTPGGVRRLLLKLPLMQLSYFNPRTPGGVRRQYAFRETKSFLISIHAPRVGCDNVKYRRITAVNLFQSTHPGWGATCEYDGEARKLLFQSTHPGWGATGRSCCRYLWYHISIHAPRVGCDAR